MPELPEVETILRGLKKRIINQKINEVIILCKKSFIGTPKKGIIKNLRRFGKALVIDLDNGASYIVHLRMTGQLIYDDSSSPADRFAAGHPSNNFIDKLPNKQTRVILRLDKGVLFFNDQRKFGFFKTVETKNVEKDAFISKLAKEPWKMTKKEFYKKLQNHYRSPIKSVLLNQSIICGLGNIYADESLFVAKIHPAQKAGQVTEKQSELLLHAARDVMQKSIDSGGSTMSTYVKPDGTKGDYLEKFAQVFRREDRPCSRCGEKIIKIRVAGRGTHICPNCQTLNADETLIRAPKESAR